MDEAVKGKVLSHIKSGDVVDLCKRLLRIPSFKTQEQKVARFLASYFQRRGYEVDFQEVEKGRYQTIAKLKGKGGGKSLMLNGHIDIDPLAMNWKRDPWVPVVEGDRLYGAGAFNMKGGVASMISAAEAIRKSGVSLDGDIILACVVGELQGGVGTVYALDQGIRSDMAIVAEPFGCSTIMTTHAGVIGMAINTLGYSRHITVREQGIDAIDKMMKVIHAVSQISLRHSPHPDLPGLPRINCGSIIGGRGRNHDLKGPNFVSDFCTSIWDVRIVPGQTAETVREDVRRLLERLGSDDSDLHWELEIPPPPQYKGVTVAMDPVDIPKDEFVVGAVARAFEQHSGESPGVIGALLPRSYAGNDTCHLWKAGIPCVLNGPGGDRNLDGEPDTFVYVSEMVKCAKTHALTALEVCNLAN